MTDKERRLDRMLPLLTAKERALIMLRDFKAGEPQDRTLLNKAPALQANAINRYVGMMNAANGDLAHFVRVILERAKQEELRFYWLEWARFTALEMHAVRAAFAMSAREPITESDYRKREAQERAALIPLDECAILYTEYHHVFTVDEYETDDAGDQVPTDEAWYRVRDAKLDEMRRAVVAGTLKASGKGKRTKVESGSLHDFIGERTPVPPDLGIEYVVRPDDRWREVERERKDQQFIKKVLDRGACAVDLPLDMEAPLGTEPSPGSFGVETVRIIAVALRSRICENWRELRAIEEKIDGFAEEFDGEDVLHPSTRERMGEAKAMLLRLRDDVEKYTGPFDLPEPDEELRDLVEKIVERELRNVPTR